MNNVHLSKSRYCSCVQCKKIFWLNTYKPDFAESEDKTVLFENGRKVGELAKGLFGPYEDIEFDMNLSNMIEKTNELLPNKPNIITEASFTYDNNFCSVDILKNDEDGVKIYEVKSSTGVKEIYLDDASYQYYVLSHLGLNVKNVAIIHISNKYFRDGELDLDQLFNIEDITDITLKKQDEIRYNIEQINKFMNEHDENKEPIIEIGNHCFEPYHCDYWQYCTRDLPKPNVFDIKGMQTNDKLKNYNAGKISFEDLKDEDINPKFLEQIDFELNDKKPKIEKDAIKEFLDSLKYPLYFIDYESCQYAIPELEGTRAYQQIPFQYSLHIIKEEGAQPEHREFLAEADDENVIRHFAESMIKDISEDGSVIVYNKSFESGRNREIGRLYADLKDEMERINSNMVDLMVPFKNRNYYAKEMNGSHSLKYVLPALYPNDPELDYHNLPVIHHGGEAAEAFLRLNEKSKEEQDLIRDGLLRYCELDSLAMVKIWEKFKEVTE